jgi:hypothetical protein
VAAEIADTFGMIGGVERRWGLASEGADREVHLRKSVEAYDQGFVHEEPRGTRKANTYNRINRIIGRVLLRPAILDDAAPDGDFDVRAELQVAEQLVPGQIDGPRNRDAWAYCDLLTIQLLAGKDEAAVTLDRFPGLRLQDFVYKSILDTLEPLAEIRPELRLAVTRLREMASG